VYVAMLTLIVSQRLLNHIRSITTANIARITNLRWSEVFYTVAPIIMERVIREIGVEEDPLSLMVYLLTESVDPNVTRKKPRLMSDWIENSQEIAPNN